MKLVQVSMSWHSIPVLTEVQGLVVRKVDNVEKYPVDSAIGFPGIFRLDIDSLFEQPGPEAYTRSKIWLLTSEKPWRFHN